MNPEVTLKQTKTQLPAAQEEGEGKEQSTCNFSPMPKDDINPYIVREKQILFLLLSLHLIHLLL